jgi:hypothetical protein
MKGMQESKDQDQMDQIAKFLTPIMDGLSKLSDADSEIVLYGLLNAAEIKMAQGNWAKVATGSMLMQQDLELPVLIQVAGKAFMFNLSGFFSAVPKASQLRG